MKALFGLLLAVLLGMTGGEALAHPQLVAQLTLEVEPGLDVLVQLGGEVDDPVAVVVVLEDDDVVGVVDLRDPPLVSSTFKGGFQEDFEVRFSLQRIRQPLAESDGVCVIVLTSQVCDFCIPAKSSTYSLMLVQSHVDSVSAAADRNTGITFTRFYC